MKVYTLTFTQSLVDRLTLEEAIKAFNNPSVAARFKHTVEYDDSTEITTVKWWRIQTGGFNGQ